MTKPVSQDLSELLSEHGQQHLVDFWDQLHPTQQQQLESQLRAVDLPQINSLYQQATKVDSVAIDWSQVQQAPVKRLAHEASSRQAVIERGVEALRANQVAVVLVAGGQGSERFGIGILDRLADDADIVEPIEHGARRRIDRCNCGRQAAILGRAGEETRGMAGANLDDPRRPMVPYHRVGRCAVQSWEPVLSPARCRCGRIADRQQFGAQSFHVLKEGRKLLPMPFKCGLDRCVGGAGSG